MARAPYTKSASEAAKVALAASWEARDRSELLEARALIADLHEALDRANAAAVRMAQTSRPALVEMTAITGARRFVRG